MKKALVKMIILLIGLMILSSPSVRTKIEDRITYEINKPFEQLTDALNNSMNSVQIQNVQIQK